MDRFKYPKTPHLPWSNSVARDDKVLSNTEHFEDSEVIVTIKMDGENTTVYSDGFVHARSIDSKQHESRTWMKNFAAQFSHKIPKGWRICGENMYATHSIHYKDLKSYFLVFAVWDDENVCLSWDDTILLCKDLSLEHVDVLLETQWVESNILHDFITKNLPVLIDNNEGYVVRVRGSFNYDEFDRRVAKYVRKNHVQSDEHWMYKEIIKNELK